MSPYTGGLGNLTAVCNSADSPTPWPSPSCCRRSERVLHISMTRGVCVCACVCVSRPQLSHEMTQLIDPGGKRNSEHFLHFMHLVIQGYLVARQHMDSILSTVSLMADSGLPCFGHGKPLERLRRRFHPELSNYEAAAFMKATVRDAYDKWTTRGYDIIQYLQQGITH